jgi:organic radical activating enzyme
MNVINSYTNGNTKVTIYDDGTKVRECPDNESPVVEHPESIDTKITNQCDGNCKFCHEMSAPNGQHADLDKLLKVLSVLPAGVEIAVGGGNPLSHPILIPFLESLKAKGLIANMTVNHRHLKRYHVLLPLLIDSDLIKGIGISYNSNSDLENLVPIIKKTDNLVFHLIMGVHNVDDIGTLNSFCAKHGKKCKILVLGYKICGRGISFAASNSDIELNKYQWYTRLWSYLKRPGIGVISFDNLAIDQLNLQRYFTNTAWREFYMGRDGAHTCYIDAVKQEYAISSTSNERVSFKNCQLLEFFEGIK